MYLSTVNAARQDTQLDLNSLKQLSSKIKHHYELAVELQYSHLLGKEHDKNAILDEICGINDCISEYVDFSEKNNFPLIFKTPEIDSPILIAIRAHELCEQYPQLDMLVGLSSGGVELSTVASLIARHKTGKDIPTIHYPISVHQGLSMWSKDKTVKANQSEVDEFSELEKVSGKFTVVCEDNSNSGQTLDRVMNRLKSNGAAESHFAVIEIYPTRLIMHSVQQKAGAKHNIGQVVERERPIVNYMHPDFVGAISVVKILLSDTGFSKVIAIDTANKYTKT